MNADLRTATHQATSRPTSMTVLYDAGCPVCRRARHWVEGQRQLVRLEFVVAGSPAAGVRFPALDPASTLTDVTVITDDGAVYRGEQAWIAVLWALARTRPTAIALAQGRRTRLFRHVKGATEAVRRLAVRSPDPGPPPTSTQDQTWPSPAASSIDRCSP